MSKSSKSKKSKVPKLTEAEYAEYIDSIKNGEGRAFEAPRSAMNVENTSLKTKEQG